MDTAVEFDPVVFARELGFTLTQAKEVALRRFYGGRKSEGYTDSLYLSAPASYWLLVRQAFKIGSPIFSSCSFRVITVWDSHGRRVGSGIGQNEACIHYVLPGETEEYMEAAEGVGPIDALHAALAKIWRKHFGSEPIHLVDYLVHNLDPQAEAASAVSVTIQSRNGNRIWTTVGVDVNIITASWFALLDAMTVAVRGKDLPTPCRMLTA